MRQIVLDTETTGLEPKLGHRIIEIGCVELIDRKLTGRHYHQYINPNREIDTEAIEIHGITNDFLGDKPAFSEVALDFLAFIKGAELVIHNAPFDIGFIDHEFALLQSKNPGKTTDFCSVVDTLVMARQKHPGQRNSLDALCGRYDVDNAKRELHGALLDAEILADVYLMLTGGQVNLLLSASDMDEGGDTGSSLRRISGDRPALKVVMANDQELAAHDQTLQDINKASDGNCQWSKTTV
ncbi:MAG: DNA polymerase III subunit epsilon [Spongiibacteraceae bacterium]|nr:DNA polymerase III subunit epsilon [Spongiibacteraceae bacterium]